MVPGEEVLEGEGQEHVWEHEALARDIERKKYSRAYQGDYGMGPGRMRDATADMKNLPRGSYLDVGCGRGEMLRIAKALGFSPVQGVDVVESLGVLQADAFDLPFESNSVDVVSMFDVIEHLLPGDDALACSELSRVAKKHVLVTASNRPSKLGDINLHINIRPYDEWDALFREWFVGDITRIRDRNTVNETWRIDL